MQANESLHPFICWNDGLYCFGHQVHGRLWRTLRNHRGDDVYHVSITLLLFQEEEKDLAWLNTGDIDHHDHRTGLGLLYDT